MGRLLRLSACVLVLAAACAPPEPIDRTRGVEPEIGARITSARGARLLTLRPPSVVRSREGKLLVYEVVVAPPTSGVGMAIERMDVSAGALPLTTLDAPAVAASMIVRGTDNREIRPVPATITRGQAAVVFMLHTLPLDAVVTDNLAVAVTLRYTDGQTESPSLDLPVIPVPPVVLGAPVTGGPWLATNALSNTSAHRRYMPAIPYLRVPERYAIDYVLTDDAGLASRAPGTKNEDYLGYGADVLAVAGGEITSVKDGAVDNPPGMGPDPATVTFDNAYGNVIVLSLNQGGHAVYAHLKAGSFKVKVGDKVKRGDVLAAIGNSGDSKTPRLHIHVADATEQRDKEGLPFGTDGVPFVFDRFTFLGKQPGARVNEPVQRVVPTENDANTF